MTILVTGARGNVGRAVLGRLLALGVPVRAMSRNPEAAGLPAGVDVADADLTEPDSLRPALRGVRKIFLYARPQGVDGVLALAREAGVEHIVVLSSAAVVTHDLRSSPIAQSHVRVERAVAESGIPWTFLQPAAFATNALQWAPDIRAESVVRAAYGEAQTSPIHERDIAAVGVAALTGTGHEGVSYVLTGPESLTQRRQAEIIGAAAGREIRFEELPPEAMREQMRLAPPGVVDTLLKMLADSVGRPAMVTDTVEKVTGARARTFTEWAADHVDDFR